MQNEVGITALQPEDIKQTNIPQGLSSRKARRDEFKQLSPQEQEQSHHFQNHERRQNILECRVGY